MVNWFSVTYILVLISLRNLRKLITNKNVHSTKVKPIILINNNKKPIEKLIKPKSIGNTKDVQWILDWYTILPSSTGWLNKSFIMWTLGKLKIFIFLLLNPFF